MTKILFTSGDYNGIGLECFYKALQDLTIPAEEIIFSIAANKNSMLEYFDKMNFNYELTSDKIIIGNYFVGIESLSKETEVEFGKLSSQSGAAAAESIIHTLDLVSAGKYDAMLTLPINKKAMYLSGWEFPGHTEMIASKFGITNPLMILSTGDINVALATIHIPVSQVPAKINQTLLIDIITKFEKSLRKELGYSKPKIAVLGLNPHAGENGSIGNEELEIINPAIEKMKQSGLSVFGAFPADGFFAHGLYTEYSGILAMYHDQGLIPLKLLAKGGGVNFTGNLPIIRTSPDHGTAFEIAGKKIANPESTINAIEFAMRVSKNKQKS